jgi:pilus assembly protein CpaB
MLNSRSLILLFAALLLALAAVFVVQRWLNTQKQAAVATPAIETIPVVTAAAQINPLDKIKLEQLKVMEIPKASLPFDASLPNGGLNFFAKPDEIVGKFATQTLYANEVIVRQRLRDSLGGSSLSNILSPGMRAVSVRVNEATGVAGFLLPGNYVDIISTHKAPDSDGIVTQLVLQNVKILAVDQYASTDDKGAATLAKTATVEVRPQDASKLLRSAEIGTIQMELRNPADVQLVPEVAYASRDELTRAAPVTAPPVQAVLEKPSIPSPPPAPRKPGKIRTLLRDGRPESFECFNTGCRPLDATIQQKVMEGGFKDVGKAVNSTVINQGQEVEGSQTQ